MKRQALLTKGARFVFVLAMTAGLFCVTFALIGVIGTGDTSPPTAYAAGTINVTTFADEYDKITPNGTCSLREAVQSIIYDSSFGGCTNTGGADTVQLQVGTYTLTRLLASGSTQTNSVGSLYVYNSSTGDDFTVNILGAGSDQTIISTTASFDDRVFGFYDSSFNNTSSVAIEGVTIQGGNSNGSGGGIYIQMASQTASFSLKDAVIQNNQVGDHDYGGGLYLGSAGHTTLERVTVYNNWGYYGGGIYYTDQYGDGQDGLTLINVTIYSNTAGFVGGGLYAYGSGGGVTATNVTIANNKGVSSSGNIYNYGTTIRLQNTIIADGINNDCGGNPSPDITSLGYNMASDNTCSLGGTGDVNSTDPLLDSQLRYNGSTMPTLALIHHDSWAINNGSGCPDTDQRGFPRLGPCDIGAFEYAEWGLSLPLVLKNE